MPVALFLTGLNAYGSKKGLPFGLCLVRGEVLFSCLLFQILNIHFFQFQVLLFPAAPGDIDAEENHGGDIVADKYGDCGCSYLARILLLGRYDDIFLGDGGAVLRDGRDGGAHGAVSCDAKQRLQGEQEADQGQDESRPPAGFARQIKLKPQGASKKD